MREVAKEQETRAKEGFTPLADGPYTVAAAKVEEGESAKGDPMITVTFEITKAPKFNGFKVRENFMWATGGWKVLNVLQAGASPLADDEDLTINKFVKWLNKGVVVGANVIGNEYTNGKGEKVKGNRIKDFFNPKEGPKVAKNPAPAVDDDDDEPTTGSVFK